MKNMAISKMKMMGGDDVVADVGYSNKGLAEKSEKPEYPYCLKMYLSQDELSKLGIEKLPELNSVVDLMAKAVVVAVRNEHESKTMELQITDMEISQNKKSKAPESALYGSAEEEKED